ncbi:putative transmembrane protein [Rhizoctonia solani 123E]|uniref:Putative transmembrane protein n=1 Tax=Rhizoctonia solani 123E TaxID=1423351 RepID=A0A074RY65_9AGAM|nr:putative transmembrane protein [Rhizoctonia solani 123E]
MLSDKAKGKQRATNDEDTELEQRRPVTIRFTESEPDLLLGVSSRDTIRDVKALVRSLRPLLERRRLRLVHAGRLLTDGTRLVPWLEALEAHSRKSSAQNAPSRSPVSSPTNTSFPSRKSTSSIQEHDPEPTDVWIHCSIGPEGEDSDGDDKQQEPQIAPLRGFDRLASAGFSADDIESMRRQFHAERPEVLDQDDEHARALEEQWVDNMDSGLPGESSNDGESMYPPYLHGILVGFFFPLIPMFFLRELPPPAFFSDNVAPIEAPRSVVFSRRMQMALVAGFFANVLYGTLNYFY